MKKLKLKALELGASEVLTREQLKNVLGGDGSGSGGCTFPPTTCTKDSDCGGNCPKCVPIPHQTYSICATS